PLVIQAREAVRVTFAQFYPAPMPDAVRKAFAASVLQSDSRLAEVLNARTDAMSDDIAADLASLSVQGRISRLRQAIATTMPPPEPTASPLLEKITRRLTEIADVGDRDGALDILSSLFRVPKAAVATLAQDDDPLPLALGLRGVCLEPALTDTLRGSVGWAAHPGRRIVESPAGYGVGRSYVAALRRRSA
ncbi:MAG: hypothetical protein AAF321_08645, partial [Pseudomonadota bacterium]